MFEFSDVKLNNLIVHRVGNKSEHEELTISKAELEVNDEVVTSMLLKYFLSPFKERIFFNFIDDENLENNQMFLYADELFNNKENFYDTSVKIADFLYDTSEHPNIKSGELYIVYLGDCVVDEELVNAIGIFKSENKDTYMKVFQNQSNIQLGFENGINIKKLDKACLIFNTERDEGYKICMIDNTNKNQEAQYWKDDFLHIKRRTDDFYNTNSYIEICRDFSQQVLTKDNKVDKTKQVEFVKKAEDYFREKDTFDEDDFLSEVVENDSLKNAFKEYKEVYTEHNDIDAQQTFEIAPDAVRKAKKNFKSVIKLDKNFHVYVHGKPEFIEKGFDSQKGMHFYKLFYDKEE